MQVFSWELLASCTPLHCCYDEFWADSVPPSLRARPPGLIPLAVAFRNDAMPTREELKASAKLRHFESQYDVLTTPIRPACGHLTFVVDRGMDQCLECSMRANKELKLETARAIDYSGQDG